MITFAVGDIHGCFDRLRLILDRIDRYARRAPSQEPSRIVLLGDYVNGGPDSRRVLDLLIDRPDITALRGHQDAMLLSAARGHRGSVWNFEFHGGAATLRSFGVAAASAIPRLYLDFLRRGLWRYVEDERRVFVHASVDPACPGMAEQDDLTLLWARRPLAPDDGAFGRYVVHGHFPQADALPEILGHRCNLDSAVWTTGILTCGIFDDTQADPIDILQTR
ncbi:metallophosphoesterase [Methylobacterium aerolatum]|uniref:Serine/threonine protein phosphatase 1 n=1 Tax=Methylobacterium aerolatum TaxID=418708 RepID=A0ABU0I0H9_9HYPH|nr:metallophosphoesterase [Methylobacterium aerolatum]MDQ0447236.1 serine/threonine protein phosphatase 1 [Methylobacterium aerolatum]GJD36904.1 Bis(5'-nucleosyl)-tetraphosphatase, symmetrical [Methylobacterium aerolatum]